MNASELKARAAELLPWAENCAASANTDSWRGIAAILRAVASGAPLEFEYESRESWFIDGNTDGLPSKFHALVITGENDQ